MRVFHLFRNLKYGGCQTLGLTLISALKNDNHYIIYLHEEFDKTSSMRDVFFSVCDDVTFIDKNKSNLFNISHEIDNYMYSKGGGVLISWFYPFSLKLNINYPMLHHAGMAALPFFSLQWLKNIVIFFNSKFFKRNKSDIVVYASKHISDTHKKNYFFSPDNSLVIYNAVDSVKFKYIKKDLFKPIRFIMVGRLDGSKDFDSFIKLASVIKQENKAEFYIAGIGNDIKRLEALNKNFGFPVSFLGNISDIHKKLHNYDVMVFLNKPIEGFGNVLVEAMLSGLLVISNDIGASKEIIKHNNTGLLASDFDSLVSIVFDIINNKIDCERLIENAYHDAMIRFSSVVFSKEYKTCLERILK